MPNAMQRAINELNPSPDYSDGSAIVNEATINGAVQQNQEAQQAAMLQQLLTNPTLTANLESSALGQAMQNNAPQQQPSMANYFQDYSRNSNDVYDSAYSDLLRQGYTTKEAEYGAAKAARDYSANRIANAQARMENGGYDPATGLITNQGLRALIDMQNESPEAAALWSQAYDLPKVGYAYDRKIAEGDRSAERQFEYNQRRDADQFGRQVQMLGIRQQMQQEEIAQRAQNAVTAAQLQSYYDAINGGATPEQAQAAAEVAGQIAYYNILSGYNGGRSGSNGRNNNSSGRSNGEKEEKLTAAQQKSLNSFQNQFTVALDMIENGTQEESGDAVDNLWNSVVDMRDKGEIDPDTYSAMYSYIEYLNKLRDNKYYGR